jgi:glutaredoxin
MAIRWFLAIALVMGCSVVHAQKVYRWVDKDGNVTYRDQPPSEAGQQAEERKLRVPRDADAAPASADDPAAKAPVVLYTVPQCSSCDAARAHLEKRKIPFSEKNVDANRAAQEELRKRSGSLSVPTITVGEKVMKGYLDSLLDGELDAAGYAKAEPAAP